MLYICYLKCTTCQKARKWLDEKHIAYGMRDIVREKPTYEELKAWAQRGNMPPRKLFNTSGLSYRSLDLKDNLAKMSDDDQLHLLASDGMLIKRPLLVGAHFVLVGYKEQEWNQQFE